MGYKLVVCSTSPNTNKNKWVVDIGEETKSDNEVDSHLMQKAETPVPDLDEIFGTEETQSNGNRIKLT